MVKKIQIGFIIIISLLLVPLVRAINIDKQPTLFHNYGNLNTTVSDDLTISSSKLKFSCANSITYVTVHFIESKNETYNTTKFKGYIYVPNPNDECWSSNLIFGDVFEDNMVYGQENKINEYINVKFLPEGKVYFGDLKIYNPVTKKRERKLFYGEYTSEQDWKNIFKFDFHGDFLDAKVTEKNTFFKLNSNEKVKVSITNKLGFNVDGGIIIRYTYLGKTFFTESTKKEEFIIKNGFSEYDLDIDTSILGDVEIDMVPYIRFLGSSMYMDKTLPYDYRVIYNIEDINVDTSIGCSSSKLCKNGFECKYVDGKGFCMREKVIQRLVNPDVIISKHNNIFIIVLISIVIILIIGGIMYAIKKRY